MPLIGHALVGWATALEAQPEGEGSTGTFWIPAVIAAAYVPDLVGQVGLIAGAADAPRLGHSLLFALVAAPLLGAALSRTCGVSYRRGLAVSAATLLLHDVMDVLQNADRQPFWPFSSRPLTLERALVPESPAAEAMVFGALFAAYLVLHRLRRHRSAGRAQPAPAGAQAWAGRLFTAALVASAVTTHILRERREAQLESARQRIERGDPGGALRELEAAARWPSTAKAGRVDYLKGEALARLGDRDQAEAHYLRSLRADPGYFWALADLALLHARGPEPAEERRRRAVPLLARLREEHPRHHALERVSQRVERALERPAFDLDKGGALGRN